MGAFSRLAPGRRYAAITKSDTVNIPNGPARALYVGVTGDVALVGDDDAAVTFKAMPVGIHQISFKRVNSTGTAATDMVAIF